MKITMLGHSTFLIETAGWRILTDPWLTEPLYWGRLRHASPVPDPHQMPPPDLILISHGHRDHCDLNTLAAFPTSLPVVVYAGCAGRLKRAGFYQLHPVKAGDIVDLYGIRIETLPGRHIGGTVTFMISAGVKKLFFGGDSLFPDTLEEALRNTAPDAAVVPVSGGGVGPFRFHMTLKEAARLVSISNPKIVIPSHYHFQLSPKWVSDLFQRPDCLNEFKQALRDEGKESTLKILDVMESRRF